MGNFVYLLNTNAIAHGAEWEVEWKKNIVEIPKYHSSQENNLKFKHIFLFGGNCICNDGKKKPLIPLELFYSHIILQVFL